MRATRRLHVDGEEGDPQPARPRRRRALRRRCEAPRGEADHEEGGAAAGRKGKYVYLFGRKTDGNGSMKPLLGGKGANLAEMCRIGLPVPPGLHHHHRGLHLLLRPQADLPAGAARRRCRPASPPSSSRRGKKFGDLKNPLLVSVRSGARDSMPGMMDTILNLGLNDQTVEALAQQDQQRRASRGTATAASSRCTATSCWACRSARTRITSRSRSSSTTLKHERYHADIEDTKLTVDDLQGTGGPLQGARQGARRQELSRHRRGTS